MKTTLKLILLSMVFLTSTFAYEITVDKTLKNANQVFYDKETNLTWQDNSESKSIKRDWYSAKIYCESLSLCGVTNWYLPMVEQLQKLYTKKSFLKKFTSNFYWSNGTNRSSNIYSQVVRFDNGNYGFYNKDSKQYVSCVRNGQFDFLTFDTFNEAVEKLIKKELLSISKPPKNVQLVKDEFETTKEFELRVKETKIKQHKEIQKYEKKISSAKIKAKKVALKKALEYTWGKPLLSHLKYDADNGYFVAKLSFEVKKDFDKKVAIKVSRKNAKDFKNKFNTLKPQAIFDYDGKSVSLKDIKVAYKNSSYLAQFTDMSIDDTKVAVNISNEFDTPKIESSNITVVESSVSTFDASKLRDYKVLDRMLKKIPQAKLDKTKWLFVVGIEQYEFTDNIAYASRSAKMFKKTMKKKLGIQESHCFTMLNEKATQARIKTNLKKMLRRVKKGDTIYFYYNGHGVPVPSQKFEPYNTSLEEYGDSRTQEPTVEGNFRLML